jgi:aspartate/methionine/tyrosine aminotransferase
MFSTRLPPHRVPNALSQRLAVLRRERVPFVDLTESNPTRAGFTYPDDLLQHLADPSALRYEPQPFGLPMAREAVAADCGRRGASVDPAQVVLTASTSEAYSWLFKLLCNPGDEVLVPRPSYPLFEHLTRLEAVEAVPYDLEYHARWDIDVASVARAVSPRTRAILVVSPNNPTGSYLKRRELEALTATCEERDLALVADEVFVDFALDAPEDRVIDVALHAEPLAFSLGGLSKSAGLPQVKLGWMIVGGTAARRAAALEALELIADSYLSVATPVQVAASDLLARGADIRRDIGHRLRENLERLRALAQSFPGTSVLTCEGGWYAVVRVPTTVPEEDLVLGLLDRERILVHPGYFFDFPREAYIVASLLPPPEVFGDAAARMLHFTATAV